MIRTWVPMLFGVIQYPGCYLSVVGEGSPVGSTFSGYTRWSFVQVRFYHNHNHNGDQNARSL